MKLLRSADRIELTTETRVKTKFPALWGQKELALEKAKSKRIRANARMVLKIKELPSNVLCFLLFFHDGSILVHRAA